MQQQKYADITLCWKAPTLYQRRVSGWVHQIIEGLPQFTFSLIFLGSRKSDYGEMKYALFDNVIHLECHYLWDHFFSQAPGLRRQP